RRRATQAIEAARKICLANPDDLLTRIVWANALVAVDDHEAALGVLNEGMKPEVKSEATAGPGDNEEEKKKDKEGTEKESREKATPAPTNGAPRRAQALVCVTWFDAKKASGKAKPAELLAVLDRGFSSDQKSGELLTRLADLLQETSGVDAEKV